MKKRFLSVALALLIAFGFNTYSYAEDTHNADYNADYNETTIAISGKVDYFNLKSDSSLAFTVKDGNKVVHVGEVSVDTYDYYYKFNVNQSVDPENLTVNVRLNGTEEETDPATVIIKENKATTASCVITNTDKGRFIADGENVTIQIDAQLKAKFEDEAKLIIAEFAADDKLIEVQTRLLQMDTDSNTSSYSTIIDDYTPSDKADYVKAYIWSSVDNMVPLGKADLIGKKVYSADYFVTEEGTLNTELEGTYTVAFIGGSLTAGDSDYEGGKEEGIETNHWTTGTVAHLEKLFPKADFRNINAGMGGTTSVYGAARYVENVLSYEPDIVFIEFCVNDNDGNGTIEDWAKYKAMRYMEKMVRLSRSCQKEPIIYFLLAPAPKEKDTDYSKGLYNQYEWKNEIAQYYGIKTINVDTFLRQEYEKNKLENESYTEYLKRNGYYHGGSASSLDVHPSVSGYRKYTEAIVAELTDADDFAKMDTVDKPVYCTAEKYSGNANLQESVFNYIHHYDENILYKGNWVVDDSVDYYFGVNGVRKVTGEDCRDAEFMIRTNAAEIQYNYISSTNGLGMEMYVDGVYYGKDNGTYNMYGGMNYCDSVMKLPNDGKYHNVVFKVNDPVDENSEFTLLNLIEVSY